MTKSRAIVLMWAAVLLAPVVSHAQNNPDTSVPKPKVYMLISAVGDQFSYVTQKQSVGSNILDNFSRQIVRIPDDAINTSVLKGLDRAIEQRDPASRRIFAKLNALELQGVRPVDREKVALGKLIAALEKFPERQEWDKIIVVTPKFQFSGRKGMGSKLEGLGVYVQPLESGKLQDDAGIDLLGTDGEETITPDGKPGKSSKQYVAPYNYTQTWVFDAKTLKVLDQSARYEFQRIYDQNATAINIAYSIPPEQLATIFTTFIEKSVARGLGEALPLIEIGDVKPAGTPTAKSK